MQVKISPPAASPVKRHGSVTFCTTDFTATKCPPCRHPPSRRGWQHFNMRAQSLAFPNFSLAKHLSLHPGTKLWQAPRASRPLSCENTNGTVRPGLYGRGNSPRLYPYSPPQTPRRLCSTHKPCSRTPGHPVPPCSPHTGVSGGQSAAPRPPPLQGGSEQRQMRVTWGQCLVRHLLPRRRRGGAATHPATPGSKNPPCPASYDPSWQPPCSPRPSAPQREKQGLSISLPAACFLPSECVTT